LLYVKSLALCQAAPASRPPTSTSFIWCSFVEAHIKKSPFKWHQTVFQVDFDSAIRKMDQLEIPFGQKSPQDIGILSWF
jgi:hypothetical protein